LYRRSPAASGSPLLTPTPGRTCDPLVTTTATGARTPAADGATVPPGSRLSLAPRLAAAAVSGALVAVALPPYDAWPLAPVGVAGLVLLCRGQRPRRAALLGLAHGLGTFVPVLSWLTVIGPDAWLLVALLEAAYLALMAALLPAVLRLRVWPLWVGCLWVAQELARDTTPFGGFPWGRLAFAETASPYTPYAALGGAPSVTFVTAVSGALLAAAVLQRRAPRTAALLGLAAVAVPAVGLALPVGAGEGKPVTVALVQGNVPGVGLDFQGEREQVLRNHVEATHRLAADVRAGKVAAPDLVVWPENASDIDPFGDAQAMALIDDAVRDVGVPVLVGTLVDGPGPDHVSNTGIVWDPTTGPGERYVKRHPVPFGEYIPFRSELAGITSRLDQIPRDFYAADKPGNLTLGPARIGDVICFEIAYDGLVRDVVRGGAQLLVVQTNNATYNGTHQPYQQMAMSRLRAVETGRVVLVTSTSGISAVVRADGSVAEQAPEKVARTLVAKVWLRDRETLSTRLGGWPERGLAVVGLLAAATGVALQRRRGRAEDAA
jgi:apolipoprotein N-acyltransferase